MRGLLALFCFEKKRTWLDARSGLIEVSNQFEPLWFVERAVSYTYYSYREFHLRLLKYRKRMVKTENRSKAIPFIIMTAPSFPENQLKKSTKWPNLTQLSNITNTRCSVWRLYTFQLYSRQFTLHHMYCC